MSKTIHYSYKKPIKRQMRLVWLYGVGVLLILAIASLVIRHVYFENLNPVSKSNNIDVVTIPSGANLTSIANILKKSGVIKSEWAFEWYVRNDNYARSSLEAGTYNLRPNQTVAQIVTILTDGDIANNLVVILPDQRIDQIETALIHDGFKKSTVVNALNPNLYVNKYSMFKSMPAGASLEGFLYPDSFDKVASTTAQIIINESLAEMQNRLTANIVNGFAAQGLNIFQGLTLASIVEQEVNNPPDLPIVAQVFITRLKANMDLGSDATAFYGSIIAGQTPSLTYSSPYNTLIYPGLPPGPISNVNETALEAVAHPASTNYLYFVTGDNGVTYYSTTLQEHNVQVQDYCQKLCSSE